MVYISAGTPRRSVSRGEPQTLCRKLAQCDAEPIPQQSLNSRHAESKSLSASVTNTSTTGLGRGASTRCCVRRVRVTEVQCSKRRSVRVKRAVCEMTITLLLHRRCSRRQLAPPAPAHQYILYTYSYIPGNYNRLSCNAFIQCGTLNTIGRSSTLATLFIRVQC